MIMANIKILGHRRQPAQSAPSTALALKAAQGLVPAGATLDIFDLPDLPGFNQDQRRRRRRP